LVSSLKRDQEQEISTSISFTLRSVRSAKATSCWRLPRTRSSSGLTSEPKTTPQTPPNAEGVQIKLYSIIYELIDQVKGIDAAGLLDAESRESVVGDAEVRKVFDSGERRRGWKLRYPDGTYRQIRTRTRTAPVASRSTMAVSRHFAVSRTTSKRSAAGWNAGSSLGTFDEYEEGDIIECYVLEKVPQQLWVHSGSRRVKTVPDLTAREPLFLWPSTVSTASTRSSNAKIGRKYRPGKEFVFDARLVTVQQVDCTPRPQTRSRLTCPWSAPKSPSAAGVTRWPSKADVSAIQYAVSRWVTMKYTPQIHFKLDTGIERGTKVIRIMDELNLLPAVESPDFDTPVDPEEAPYPSSASIDARINRPFYHGGFDSFASSSMHDRVLQIAFRESWIPTAASTPSQRSFAENRFLILSHFRPDRDAIGCSLALSLCLEELGKDVTVLLEWRRTSPKNSLSSRDPEPSSAFPRRHPSRLRWWL